MLRWISTSIGVGGLRVADRQKAATGGKCGEGYEVLRWALRSCETGFGWKGEPGTEHWQGCLNAADVVSTGLLSRLS